MMTKKEKMELATIVAQAVVDAMKATTAKPTSTKKGRMAANPKKKTTEYSTNIKDYEPKKSSDGFYNWASYKANRTKFCYAYATGGATQSCFDKGERYCEFSQLEGDYNEAKKMFNKKYKYVKVTDR